MGKIETLSLEHPSNLFSDFNDLAPSSNQLAQWRSFVSRVLNCSDEEISSWDIAESNLQCAVGLPGAENLEILSCLKKINFWTQLVRQNTEKWRPKFYKYPQRFNHSYAQFCMEAMITVLQVKLGVRYNLSFSEGDYNGTDSRNLFLHGLLSGHGGTCVTMPVLYVAIGRRLGYPLKLVHTWEHTFVRWDELGGERFNIEATSIGYVSQDDEYYKRGRYYLNEAKLRSGAFMRNLTPRQALAFFLKERASCLRDNMQLNLAVESAYYASQLAPHDPCIEGHWEVNTMIYMLFEEMRNQWRFNSGKAIMIPNPSPQNERERWAIEKAQKELARIFKIHGVKNTLKHRDILSGFKNTICIVGPGTIIS